MWVPLLCLFIVGLTSAEYGWKAGTQYSYEVRGRTLTGLNQASNQYSGMNIRAKLSIQAKSDQVLSLQVHGAQYAEIHSNLTDGWTTEIPEWELQYSTLPIRSEPFEVVLLNGVVKEMVVDKTLPVWELNMLKSIVSLLQVDTQGKNLKKSKLNLLPSGDDVTGTYKTMEDSIHGKYETIYDISEIPEFIVQTQPEMAPLPHLRGDGKFISIVKTRNFSDSDQHIVYHHGMSGTGKWEPASNQMGSFLSRSSGSRIIVSGSLQRYVIQSSVTDEKIVIAPHLFNNQKGVVATRLNMTLEGVSPAQGTAPEVSNPMKVDTLVYQYQSQGKKVQNRSSNEGSSSSEVSESTSAGKQASLRRSIKMTQDAVRDVSQSSESSSSSSGSSSSSSSDSSSSESSESLSSSEEYYHEISGMEEPSQASFLVFYVGYNGQSIHQAKDFNGVAQSIKMSKEIASDMESPESITGSSTLDKFTILTSLIRTMSLQQLKQVEDKLYTSYAQVEKSPEEAKDYLAWVVFRDTVAQAGTSPALLTIKDWIKTKKVQGEEAAKLISVLPSSARYPTEKYIETFFEMVKDNEMEKQRYLNTSLIISFADLVRQALVDEKDMHYRYPVHMFGPTNELGMNLDKYIEYFNDKLQRSVKEGDSIKIQAYINALGNIAHRQILAAYKPYLEGKKPISKYQRLVMVASLDKMTKVYPEQARAVLYRIYQNTAEAPEIRTAAVMQIMKTNPPAQMLQRMAQRTNSDHSKEVNAAVKSAIESAARQPINRYNKQLTENARSAVDMLTPENFGLHNSRNYIRSFIVKEGNLGYKHQLSYIQSRDSILPRSVSYILKRNLGGYKRDSHYVQFMTSSVDHLIEKLSERFHKPSHMEMKNQKKRSSTDSSSWSIKQLYQMLDFEEDGQDQLEGSLLISALGGQRYFHFDNHTIDQLPQIAWEMRSLLQNGKNFNFTKFYNQYSYDVAFSTAMGLPFIYSMSVPTVVSLGGQVKTSQKSQEINGKKANRISIPDILHINGSYDVIYSVKRQGKMGFVTPFNSKVYVAGLEKNIQVRIPVQAVAGLDMKNKRMDATLEPLHKDKKHKIFEYSSDAYTTSYDVLDMKPLKNKKHTVKLQTEMPQELKKTVGQEATGFAFDINIKGDAKITDFGKISEQISKNDIMSLLLYGDMDDEINNSNVTVVYNPEKSAAKRMSMSLQYTKERSQSTINGASHNKHRGGSNPRNEENLALPKASQRKERQEELLKNVMAGIESAQGHMLDMSVGFDDEQKREYVISLAYASSPVSEDSRFLAYLKNFTAAMDSKPYQVALHLNMKTPQVPLVNFKEALKADPTSKMEGRLEFGEKTPLESYIKLEGKLMTSPERKEYLRRHPLSALCEKQMEEGLNIQPACRNVTARANYLDTYQLTFNYQNLPEKIQNLTRMTYRVANQYWYPYSNESVIDVKNKEGQIAINIKFGKGLRKMNMTLTAPNLYNQFEAVPINGWLRPIFVMHPSYGIWERFVQKTFRSQFYPVCTLDGDYITTFDNSSYQVKMGNRPHVLAQSIFKYEGLSKLNEFDDDKNYFSIIAKQKVGKELEMTILAGDNVFEIQPTGEKSADFKFNEKVVTVKEGSGVPLSDESGVEVMQVLFVPNGSYKVFSKYFGFELIWSGKNIRLQVNNGFRGKIRGLCGNFDGVMYNDLVTPQGLIVNNTKTFTASYAISSERTSFDSGKQQTAGFKEEIILGKVISDQDIGLMKRSRIIKNSELKVLDSKPVNDNFLASYKIQVVQEPGKTCFSLRPQMTCGANAKASKLIEKVVDFHCVTKSNASKHWEKMVQLGATPDFTQKGANHRAALKVPDQCVTK